MNVGFARPDVSDLVFHLFDRTLHPELFEVYAAAEVVQDDYAATMQICNAGHLISFRAKGQTITEVTTTRQHPLPQRKRYLQKRLRGCRDETVQFESGTVYHVSYQLEQLDPEVFLNFHEELLIDCNRAKVSHQFPGGNRLAPHPLSFIQTDIWPHSLLIHTFHTFPENCAVVKTQSLFEL